jgi:uncharacterized protein YacL (UPF0231 family)
MSKMSVNIDQLVTSTSPAQIGEYVLTLSAEQFADSIVSAKAETVEKVFESTKTVQEAKMAASPSMERDFLAHLFKQNIDLNRDELTKILGIIDKLTQQAQDTINACELILSMRSKMVNAPESIDIASNFIRRQFEKATRDLADLQLCKQKFTSSLISQGDVAVE